MQDPATGKSRLGIGGVEPERVKPGTNATCRLRPTAARLECRTACSASWSQKVSIRSRAPSCVPYAACRRSDGNRRLSRSPLGSARSSSNLTRRAWAHTALAAAPGFSSPEVRTQAAGKISKAKTTIVAKYDGRFTDSPPHLLLVAMNALV